MKKVYVFILFFILCINVPVVRGSKHNFPKTRLETKELSLGKISPGILPETILISPNNRRIAYAKAALNGKAIVVIDGKESPEYDDVDNFEFSPDSKRFAYAAFSGSKWFAVIDGVKQKEYERLGYDTIKFSPDNKRFCYMVWEPSKNQQFIVVDGIEQQRYVGIFKDYPIFSSDSSKIIYGAKKGDKYVAVINEKEDGELFDAIDKIFLSPDGKHWAYAAELAGKWYLVADGKKSRMDYDHILKDSIVFSPDSNQLAYAAVRNDKSLVVLNGKEDKPYDGIDTITFSPDSNRFAYRAVRDNKQLYVIDGKLGKEYDGVSRGFFIFSPDSKHTAYMALDKKKECIVLDSNECKKYDSVTPCVFNPADNSLIYCAEQDGKWFLVTDGKEGNKYEAIDAPVVSSDGKHIAFRAQCSGISKKQIIVIDSSESEEFDLTSQSSLKFTPDNHLTYRARKNNKDYAVVDNILSKGYDMIYLLGEFTFTEPDDFNFIAVRENQFLLVDIKILEEKIRL